MALHENTRTQEHLITHKPQCLFNAPPHYYTSEGGTTVHLTIRRAWHDVSGAQVSSAGACWNRSGRADGYLLRCAGGSGRNPAGHLGNALLLQLFEVKFNNLFSLCRERERQIKSDTRVYTNETSKHWV